jgi:uncharacterized protein (DUF58 family)
MFRDFVFPAYARLSSSSRRASRRSTERGQFIQTSAVVCGAIGIDTNLTLAYQLFAFLICLIIVSRLSLRIQVPNVTVRRRLPKYATAGQPFEYLISVHNEGKYIEQGLKLIDNPTVIPPDLNQFKAQREPGEETRNAYDRWIGFHRFIWLQRRNTGITVTQGDVPETGVMGRQDTRMEALPLRRGIVNFKSTTLLCPDPLGLVYSVKEFAHHEQLMVLPRRYEIAKHFELQAGRHFQPGGVNSTWSIGESDDFVSLRDYRDGDSMRKIHWASSAKRDKPVVKEFQDEFFVRQALVLDTYTDDDDLLEEVVSVGASLLLQTENSDGLMDLIYVSDSPQIVTAGRGFAQANHQLEALATIQKSNDSGGKLIDTLATHQKLMSGCILVVPEWNDSKQQLFNSLSRAGIPTSLFILTRDENQLPQVPASARLLPLGEIAERLANL